MNAGTAVASPAGSGLRAERAASSAPSIPSLSGGPRTGLTSAMRLAAVWFGLLALWASPAAALAFEDIADDTFWNSVRGCTDAVEVELYLAEFSEGRHAAEARECLVRLGRLPAEPEPAPKKVRSTEVERMLEVCEMHFEANRLTTGVGGTAVECYGEVQARDPGNVRALEGLQRVFDKYERWARGALERADAAKVRKNVDKLRELNPEAPEVEELENALSLLEKRAEEEAEARRDAEAAEARRKAEEEEARRRAEEAAKRDADDAAFARAKAEGTQEAYERYVREYPEGLHVAEAERHIERLRSRVPAHGETFRDCEVCPLMVAVRPGTYEMGWKWFEMEGPIHEVAIPAPIAMGVYEVTFDEWDACHAAGGCSHRPRDAGWGRGRYPVINVSWKDAQQYVKWLSGKAKKSYRLPSEAEWEYVARAGATTRFPWGSQVGVDNANCKDCGGNQWNSKGRTTPVGSFPANAFGVHDMHGNVWERVQDCFNRDYRDAPRNGSAWVTGNCNLRMMRGGAWDALAFDLRSSVRGLGTVDNRTRKVGFRVVRTLTR